MIGRNALAMHAMLVLDRARTLAFAAAIRAEVRPDDVVLDLGTGSGVLAMLAARAGARRVFGVERGRAIELARANVRDAGLDARVELLHGDLFAIDALPERPTLVLGELFGTFAPDEQVHRAFRHALSLATSDARTLPLGYRVQATLAASREREAAHAFLEGGLDVPLRALSRRLGRTPTIARVDPAEGVSTRGLSRFHALVDPLPSRFEVDVVAERDASANAIVVGFEATLAEGHRFGAGLGDPPTHWDQLVLPIDPLSVQRGDALRLAIEPRTIGAHGSYRWSVERGGVTHAYDGLDADEPTSRGALAALFGLAPQNPGVVPTPTLRAWQAILDGSLGPDVATLVTRLTHALPERFADPSEARDEVMRLLLAADAPER